MRAGWLDTKRPEVLVTTEKALEENQAKFDHLVDSEKKADAIKDFFSQRVASAVKLLVARRPKDDEEWVIRSRAHVSRLLKQRKDEREEAHKRRGVTMKVMSPEQKRKVND